MKSTESFCNEVKAKDAMEELDVMEANQVCNTVSSKVAKRCIHDPIKRHKILQNIHTHLLKIHNYLLRFTWIPIQIHNYLLRYYNLHIDITLILLYIFLQGVLLFSAFGCTKDTQKPCWLTLCHPLRFIIVHNYWDSQVPTQTEW